MAEGNQVGIDPRVVELEARLGRVLRDYGLLADDIVALKRQYLSEGLGPKTAAEWEGGKDAPWCRLENLWQRMGAGEVEQIHLRAGRPFYESLADEIEAYNDQKGIGGAA